MAELVGALDQGTTSTRFVVFDHDGGEVSSHQLEHRQLLGHAGHVEHDPVEILETTRAVIEAALRARSLALSDLCSIGITNQRETTVMWERGSGQPVAPAIVWQDTRTAPEVAALVAKGVAPFVRERTGLPLSTYPSATKIAWLLEHVPDARRRARRGELAIGTIDSWLIWKLTGRHVTDATNASRTQLMNLGTLEWDDELLSLFGVARELLPEIGPSTRPDGELVAHGLGVAGEVAIGAILGDQHAALFGHGCFSPGDAKNTYGTGNFVLVNTGDTPVPSDHGLITTLGYQFARERPVYALEGAIASTGSAVQWLRDQLGVIETAGETEPLARSVSSTEGLYFVPAFSGLFAPYWRSDARGVVVGLTRAHTRAHLARATLEAAAYQSREVIAAIGKDAGVAIGEIRVDGGMTANDLCMQIQADVLGIPVVRAAYPETTVRGAAFAAGLASGLWLGRDELPVGNGTAARRWTPAWSDAERATGVRGWERAIERSFSWVEDDPS